MEFQITSEGCLTGLGATLKGSTQELKIISAEIEAEFSAFEQRDTHVWPILTSPIARGLWHSLAYCTYCPFFAWILALTYLCELAERAFCCKSSDPFCTLFWWDAEMDLKSSGFHLSFCTPLKSSSPFRRQLFQPVLKDKRHSCWQAASCNFHFRLPH